MNNLKVEAGFLGTYHTPFIGREMELDALHQVLDDTSLNGHFQCVFVTGEAGIGKTRLVSEFTEDAALCGWQVWVGHSQSIGEGLAFGPLIEAFRIALNRLDPTKQRKISEEFPYINIFFPNLEGISPIPLIDYGLERIRVFESLRLLTVHLASEQPVLLWMDDLSEADADTIAWIQYLAQHTQQARIVLLATCRTHEAKQDDTLTQLEYTLSKHTNFQRVALSTLSVNESTLLIRQTLTGDVDTHVIRMLAERTVGLPFYISEVLRMLVQTEGLVFQNGCWYLKPGAESDVPEGITSMVQRRLTGLSPEEQDTVNLLAVSDGLVPWSVLLRASGQANDSVIALLSTLVEKGLLVEHDGEWETQYGFRHPMMKEVTYSGLSATRLRSTHERMAHAWAEDIARAAYHIRSAGAIADSSTAASMLYEAGKRYISIRAYSQAVEYLEHAEQTASRSRGAVSSTLIHDIRLCLSEALTYVDRPYEAVSLLKRLYSEAVDQVQRIRLKRWMAWVESVRSIKDSMQHIEDGLASWDGTIRNDDVLWMLNERVFHYANIGDFSRADAALTSLEGYAKQFPSARSELFTAIRQTHLAILSDTRPYQQVPHIEHLLSRAYELDDVELIYDVYCLHGNYVLNLGDFHLALKYASTCTDIVRNNGMVVHEVSSRMVCMLAIFLSGQWAQAMAEADEIEQMSRSFGLDVAVACILEFKALVLVLQGNRPKALSHLREAAYFSLQVFPIIESEAGSINVSLAVELFWRDRIDQAPLGPVPVVWVNSHGLSIFLKLVEGLLDSRMGWNDQLADVIVQLKSSRANEQITYITGCVHFLEGLLAKNKNKQDQASASFMLALSTYEKLALPFETALAQLYWAQFNLGSDLKQQIDALGQCIETFERLGAGPLQLKAEEFLREINPSKQSFANLGLTPREQEISKLVGQGLSNKKIAELLHLSPRTVSTHLEKIYRKLDVHSRAALVGKMSLKD